jgi:hypothetical protein
MYRRLLAPLALSALLCGSPALAQPAIKILLPLGQTPPQGNEPVKVRSAFQTNERIELTVLRSHTIALPAGDLALTLRGEDGSRLSFTFPVARVEVAGGEARAAEHLYLNGWLLRPAKYTAEVVCDGATASVPIEVYSHLRRSDFRLINWVQRQGKVLALGEDNLGYNLYYGQAGADRTGDLIRAGVDYMSNCTMSGGHQMDLRTECDWSDPLVIRGGTRRVVREAFRDRTLPNVLGVHFYDEPGLTWHKHPKTGLWTPQGIPSQRRSYEAAFGKPAPEYFEVDPKKPADARRWAQWARWKLGFMDAAWQDAQFGVSAVRSDYLSVTQSQYGWTAFTDGYYFNVVRSLPVISGHGGYHDYGPGYFNPSFFLEMARGRDLSRPNWYLPTWYGNTTPDEFRLEQYLSFQTNIQGMMSPPDLDPGDPAKSKAAAGIVASNKLMGRLGTIFTTMPPTRPPVGVLYSLSAMIRAQTLDRDISYAHATPHGRNLAFTYLAGKLIQQPFLTVLDEDVRDGTLAAHHKAVILISLDYLDPEVVAGLEAFAKQGGLVLMTDDCKVQVKGAVNLGVVPQFPDAAKIAALEKTRADLQAAKRDKEASKVGEEINHLISLRFALAGARKLADAIRPALEKAGIKPVFHISEPGIVATRQAAGDVEYLFAVNATHDPEDSPMLGVKAVTATLKLVDNSRPVFDAVRGGPAPEFVSKPGVEGMEGKFRFGPGEMRVFARTSRLIGGVRVAAPLLRRDYTRKDEPLSLDIAAAVLARPEGLLSGSSPMRVQLIDPLGAVRYDLYRATDRGTLRLSLPLAVNDPAGTYTVKVTELLSNKEDAATVECPAVPTCSIAAGTARRALSVAGERENVFRFFRTHRKVTIVKGAGDYDAATERLVKILKPWNVEATIVKAADVNKPRSISADEAETWVGLNFAGKGQIKAGDKNDPSLVGFVVQGPVILVGTPEDNPLTKALADWNFLPYLPKKGEFPGPGRGMVAWQRDGLGALQESVTLIAHDPRGMAEAVGSLYEMLAGIEPLTPWRLPRESSVAPATKSAKVPEAAVAWSLVLADQIDAIAADQAKNSLRALTHDGTLATLNAAGKISEQQEVHGAAFKELERTMTVVSPPALVTEAQKKLGPGRAVKFVVREGDRTAVVCWGGRVEVFGKRGTPVAVFSSPQDVSAVTWLGGRVIIGDADGRLTALAIK